jgi:hypothetical protein
MSTNFTNTKFAQAEKAKTSSPNDGFNFERWANEVRPLLLAALQKRAAKP